MITWKKVVECFKDSNHQLIQTINSNQEYWNQKTLYKGMVADDVTILYFVQSNILPYITFKNNVAVIVIDSQNEIDNTYYHNLTGNTLFVYEPKDSSKGIRELDAEFQDQFKIGYIMQKLLGTVSQDGGIQQMIEMISDFFDEPIALLDTTFRFIARSETVKPISGKSKFSDDAHYGIGYNKIMLDEFKRSGLLNKLVHSKGPFCFKIQDEESAYYMPVIVNKIKVAYLIIYSNKAGNDLEDYYLEYLPQFSQMISIELAKRNFYLFNKGTYFNYIFSLILGEEQVDIEDVRMRLQIYGYELRENMYLIEIDSNDDETKLIKKDKIAESIRNTFKNSFYVFKEERVFFLISRFNDELLTSEEIESWNMSLESQKMIASITGPFTDFTNIHKHMKEVRMVLDSVLKSEVTRNVYTFKDYQAKTLISYLRQQEDVDLFLYQPVIDLIEYDDKHNAELVRTLKEFLKYPKEITLICETLNIHKNTLYKRLDKIDSIMKCDVRNGFEIMKIELTLELLQK